MKNDNMHLQINHLPIPPPGGKRSRKGRCIAIISLLAVAAVLIMFSLKQQRSRYDPNVEVKTEGEHISAVPGKEQLQQLTEESLFSFQINTRPEFTKDSREGTLFLGNSMENKSNMKVMINLNGGKLVYESPVLQPGEQILTGNLLEQLEAGEYPATARILILDSVTGEQIGENTVALNLVIGGQLIG